MPETLESKFFEAELHAKVNGYLWDKVFQIDSRNLILSTCHSSKGEVSVFHDFETGFVFSRIPCDIFPWIYKDEDDVLVRERFACSCGDFYDARTGEIVKKSHVEFMKSREN